MSHQTIYHCDHCGKLCDVDDMVYFHFSSLGDSGYASAELCIECAWWVRGILLDAGVQITFHSGDDD